MGGRLAVVRMVLFFTGLVGGTVVAACSTSATGPTRSSDLPTAAAGGAFAQPEDNNSSGSSHGLPLTAVTGSGSGVVNVTATAIGGVYTLNTQDSINVHGVPPNTVLYVRGAGDTGLPNGQQSDRVCQRAAQGLFGPVALFPGGPAATIETSAGGAGTVHITDGRNSPFLFDGATTDIMLRLVDALPPAVPTIDLRTPCFTLLVR
jgi:hypothetical protein